MSQNQTIGQQTQTPQVQSSNMSQLQQYYSGRFPGSAGATATHYFYSNQPGRSIPISTSITGSLMGFASSTDSSYIHHQQGRRTGMPGSAPRQGAPMSREEDFSIRPLFRTKVVCLLGCRHCSNLVCKRGMKAILLADMNVELFSTDAPPTGVQLVNDDYQTRNCQCRIRDVACLGCGNVIGYHVTQPCETCMEACNNGHFWMFHVQEVASTDRLNSSGTKPLVWASLPRPDKDVEPSTNEKYDSMCR